MAPVSASISDGQQSMKPSDSASTPPTLQITRLPSGPTPSSFSVASPPLTSRKLGHLRGFGALLEFTE
ncbi:hypothetical protein PI125_g21314 [Phytophthora idaei]|nr:hypothetical protein PI125_g21314 [Phytophthora idaei]